jgi:hypothetical protein
MFCTRETRLGPGVLSTPGTAVPTRPRSILDRRLPPLNDWPCHPVQHPVTERLLDEASARIH